MPSNNDTETAGTCGCSIFLLVLNLLFGAMSVNYLLDSFLGKTVGFWPAALCGLFVGSISIPLSIVCWVLRLAGVEAPFIH